jgi:hypothetical protein
MFLEPGEYTKETGKKKNGSNATRFHGPILHRPLETMTFETLGAAEDRSKVFHRARLPFGSYGLGDLHSPKPLAEIRVMLLSYFPAGPLSYRLRRSVGAKDRSSFGPQSITTTSRQLSAKTAARPVQNHPNFFILGIIARRFPSAFHFNSLRIVRDKSNIHIHLTYQGARAKRVVAWEARKKSCFLGAGDTGNVQEKTFLINCHRIAGQDWRGSGIRPEQRKKSQPHGRNSFFPEAYHSAVLRV